MAKMRYASAIGLGQRKSNETHINFRNHFASSTQLPAETKAKIASMGLMRVAGNVYECPSSQDFWQVTGGGKIVRLSGDEVDNGETIPAAPKDQPMEFLSSILDDLDF